MFTGCLSSAKKEKRGKPTLRRFNVEDSPPETPNTGKAGYSLRTRKRKLAKGSTPNCSESVKRKDAQASNDKMLIENLDENVGQVWSPGCFGSAKKRRFMQGN